MICDVCGKELNINNAAAYDDIERAITDPICLDCMMKECKKIIEPVKRSPRAFDVCPYDYTDCIGCPDCERVRGVTSTIKHCLFFIVEYHGCTKKPLE